ncbi:MAG: LPO_1073/Vpar_1526 family protein [Candidatus Saccharimonadales bacterium]
MVNKQKAGKDSNQINAERDVVIISQSASVSDIRDIVKSEIELTLSNYKANALEKYVAKGNSMIEKLVAVIGDDQSKLNAFSDPDFNYALRDAGRAVASNESEYTEELLVEILANRAAHSGSNRVKIVTMQAIEAADKLTDDTLNALTNLWVMLFIVPQQSRFEDYLAGFSRIFGESFSTLKPALPSKWIEEAELLRLIEVERGFISDTKPFVEMLSEKFPRYLRAGIPVDRWNDMNKTLMDYKHDIRINIILHPLKEGFVLVNHDSKDQFLEAVRVSVEAGGSVGTIINEIVNMNNFDAFDPVAQEQLLQLIDQDSNLKEASEWWHNLPACRVTAVGKAIGYLHAKKYITFNGVQNLEDYLSM